MSHKALTAAIAAALAAPMAAQAVDFTISGQVNRALFITDSNAGTKGEVANNGGSSTRFRANGSSKLADGSTVAIQLEYEEGNAGGTSGGQGIKMRHANIQYRGDFGAVTVGQGSEAADGSAYSDTTGVNGIGHGAGTGAGFSLGKYFGSLDGGGRTNMIRYDSPAIGDISAAVSVGNGDSVSGRLKLSTDVAGTAFGAQLAALQVGGGASTIGASFGATLASGLTISGAWAQGTDHVGVTTAAMPGRGALGYIVNPDGNFNTVVDGEAQNLATALGAIQAAQPEVPVDNVAPYAALDEDNLVSRYTNMDADGAPLADGSALSAEQKLAVRGALAMGAAQCYNADVPGVTRVGGCSREITLYGVRAATAESKTKVDPSYFQMEIGYLLGNTGVAVSWYQSEDFVNAGSSGTAIGIGARHTLPAAGADIYAAVQNYDVEYASGASADETVVMIGTKVKF